MGIIPFFLEFYVSIHRKFFRNRGKLTAWWAFENFKDNHYRILKFVLFSLDFSLQKKFKDLIRDISSY